MDYLALLQALNSCHGPAGDEGEIAEAIRTLAAPYVDEYTIDTMGNLIVHKKGSGPKVMFAAHMDSSGLIVTHIDEKGYLSFGKLGGIHPENLLHTPVRFKKGLRGVVSLRGDTAWKNMTINDLFIDIGAKNEDEARSMVEIGQFPLTLDFLLALKNIGDYKVFLCKAQGDKTQIDLNDANTLMKFIKL